MLQINSDPDLRSYWKAIAEIAYKALFRAEIAKGVGIPVQTQKHTRVALRFLPDKGRERQKYHRDYLRDEIQDEMATEQPSLSAFPKLNITTSHRIFPCFPLPAAPSPHVRQQKHSLLFKG